MNVSDAAIDQLHIPVFLDRVIELLAPAIESTENPIVLDGTLGMGGHSLALLERFPTLSIIGIDRDEKARKIATERLKKYKDRVTVVNATFDEIERALAEAKVEQVHGVLLDLGVSSLQLDDKDRGFAYSYSAPLDMRMDQSRSKNAVDVVNNYSQKDLAYILKKYGEEKFAQNIAKNIVEVRAKEPVETTSELVDIITASIPKKFQLKGGHPAKRSFQAIRVEVNEELDLLNMAIKNAMDSLACGGRIVVLSYQSLEDKIVKRAFDDASQSKLPRDFPMDMPGYGPDFKLISKKEDPSADEIDQNPRSTSVRLRAAEKNIKRNKNV